MRKPDSIKTSPANTEDFESVEVFNPNGTQRDSQCGEVRNRLVD